MLTKNDRGFSLVELLVVLAIVGILMALAVGGIRIVQEVNRDTQRKSLSRDIQLALESYQEKENEYPDVIGLEDGGEGCKGVNITAGAETVCSSVSFSSIGTFASGLGVPSGPLNGCSDSGSAETDSGSFTLCYQGGSKSYNLFIQLERSAQNFNAGNAQTGD